MNKTQKWLKWIKIDAIALCAFVAFISILFLFGETCLIKAIFDIECPCCHMTRAMICFFKFDFKGYANENFMALPILICVYFQLHVKAVKVKKVLDVFTVSVAIITFLKYLFF